MKSLTPDQLPATLDEQTIDILVDMAMEFPKTTFAWAEVSAVLEQRGQLNIILDRVQQKQRQQHVIAPQSSEDAEAWKQALANDDPKQFYGNMGQPETPEEFKNRYGQYPHGYDEHGNRTDKA